MKPLWLFCIGASSHSYRASHSAAIEAHIDKLIAQPTMRDESFDKLLRSLRALMTRTFEEIDSTEFECHAEHEASRARLLALKSDLAALRQDGARQRSFFLNARAQLLSAKERTPALENRRHEVERECSRAKQRNEAELNVLNHHARIMEGVMRQVQCNKTMGFLQTRELHQVTRCNDGTITLARQAGNVKFKTTHVPVQDANRKCVTSQLNCEKMYDLAHDLAGEVEDSKKDLESTMVKQSAECARQLAANNAAMNDLTNTVFGAQTALARATSGINFGEAQMGKKEQERRFEQKEFDASRKTCKEKLDMMRYTDLCVYRKLRKKLAESAGVPLPTDCEVGAWVVNGRCSQSCGGGTETLSREVIISSQRHGVPCPTLHWERTCKMGPCPQECKVGDWTGWSTCSTDCGGGVRQRTRDLLVEARHGATACLTTQSQICNTSSCSRDCVLSHWSSWLLCSRACGGGTRTRKRRVRKAARGHGKCPKAKDPRRWQSETCNLQACAKYVKPICAAPYDVVIVVDASGSWGSAEAFDEVKRVAVDLSSTFESASVVEFSDMAKTLHDANELEYIGRGTRIARGLIAAKDRVFQTGRPGIPTLIFLITDATTATYRFELKRVAKELKESARLMLLIAHPDDHLLPHAHNMHELQRILHVAPADVIVESFSRMANVALFASCADIKERTE